MVTNDERELIERNMQRSGIRNLGSFIRKMAIDGYVVHVQMPEMREMISLLRNATNNLNQIARWLNSKSEASLSQREIEELRSRLELVWEKIESILSTISKL